MYVISPVRRAEFCHDDANINPTAPFVCDNNVAVYIFVFVDHDGDHSFDVHQNHHTHNWLAIAYTIMCRLNYCFFLQLRQRDMSGGYVTCDDVNRNCYFYKCRRLMSGTFCLTISCGPLPTIANINLKEPHVRALCWIYNDANRSFLPAHREHQRKGGPRPRSLLEEGWWQHFNKSPVVGMVSSVDCCCFARVRIRGAQIGTQPIQSDSFCAEYIFVCFDKNSNCQCCENVVVRERGHVLILLGNKKTEQLHMNNISVCFE